MDQDLTDFFGRNAPRLERALADGFPSDGHPGIEPLRSAIHAALFPAGKRMRPLFTLLAVEACGGHADDGLDVACAIEYLHACSLILDDLPSMDDAIERRGVPTLHRQYGEAVAILAALALFNQAYALLGGGGRNGVNVGGRSRLIGEVAACLGPGGMIGGQMLDLSGGQCEPESISESYRKTTSLMRLMLTAGALASGAGDDVVEALGRFGETLGSVYQTLDDLLDRVEDSIPVSEGRPCPPEEADRLLVQAGDQLTLAGQNLLVSLPGKGTQLMLAFAGRIFRELDQRVRSTWPVPHDA